MAYELSSATHPTSHDIKILMSDSEANKQQLHNLKKLLCFDKIEDISFMRLTDDLELLYAGTSNSKDLFSYLKHQAWAEDMLFDGFQVFNFRVIDYSDSHLSETSKQFSMSVNERLTLLVDRRHHHYKDSFMFDINRKHYLGLSFENRILLFERLTSIINLCYSMIHLHTPIKLPSNTFNKIKDKRHTNTAPLTDNDLLHAFALTQTNVEYLRHIASGCTAKEIARHMDKSYRSVQDAIRNLCDKFEVATKAQLAQVARVIVSQV
jgi:DNA-binding CsgD family transcriptional regulator